ncbi:MAG: dihydrodipicolinate synthase family protein, partial [Bryobacteraceae bacterium]
MSITSPSEVELLPIALPGYDHTVGYFGGPALPNQSRGFADYPISKAASAGDNMNSMTNTKGIFPAIVTPFTAEGQINEPSLRHIIQYSLKKGVDGFYTCGAGGEGLLMTVAERQRALDIVVEEVNGKAVVIAHVGAFQTPDTLALARHASKAGADAVASLPPSYFYGADPLALEEFYRKVAGASEIPVLVYNVGGSVNVTVDTME